MTDEHVPAPSGWAEVDVVPAESNESPRHPPAAFEHDAGDVAVHVRTDGPAAGERVTWEVGVVFGDAGDVADLRPVHRGIEDRQTALSKARELMEAFDREGVPASAEAFDPDDYQS